MEYFTIHQSRHYGWIVSNVTKKKAEKLAKDPDNMDYYPFFSRVSKGMSYIKEDDIQDLVPFEIREMKLYEEGDIKVVEDK